MEYFVKTLEIISKNPLVAFVVLSAVFGYAYWEQNKDLNELTLEVGGLRVEQAKMNEIIKLKVELATQQCE